MAMFRNCYTSLFLIVCLIGCSPREPEFIPPKEAALAIVVAKQYAATNGCKNATVWGAELQEGNWFIMLEAKRAKLAFVRVSLDGRVLWYMGPM
jgi:hypothetical protein